jgi:hypothetical protein
LGGEIKDDASGGLQGGGSGIESDGDGGGVGRVEATTVADLVECAPDPTAPGGARYDGGSGARVALVAVCGRLVRVLAEITDPETARPNYRLLLQDPMFSQAAASGNAESQQLPIVAGIQVHFDGQNLDPGQQLSMVPGMELVAHGRLHARYAGQGDRHPHVAASGMGGALADPRGSASGMVSLAEKDDGSAPAEKDGSAPAAAMAAAAAAEASSCCSRAPEIQMEAYKLRQAVPGQAKWMAAEAASARVRRASRIASHPVKSAASNGQTGGGVGHPAAAAAAAAAAAEAIAGMPLPDRVRAALEDCRRTAPDGLSEQQLAERLSDAPAEELAETLAALIAEGTLRRPEPALLFQLTC